MSVKVPSPTRSATWRETETKPRVVCGEPMWPTPTAGRANWNKKQTCGPLCSAKHHAEKCRIAAGTNHYQVK